MIIGVIAVAGPPRVAADGPVPGLAPQAEDSSPTADAENVSTQSLDQWDKVKTTIQAAGAISAHVDPTSGELVVWLPDSGSSSLSVRDLDFVGRSVRFERSPLEPGDISAIRAAVEGVPWKPLRPGVAYPSAAFDSQRGTMEILSDAPADVFKAILEEFGEKVRYANESLTLTSGTRCNDVSPHYGGAGLVWSQIQSCAEPYPACTSGFSVTNGAGEPRMMTAAHCLLDGGVSTKIWSQDGTAFGYAHGYANYHTVDAGLIGDVGIDHDPYIYVGGPSSSTRKGVRGGSTASGLLTDYCFGGKRSGEHCGMTLDTQNDPYSLRFTLESGETYTLYWLQLWNTIITGTGACPGDSGAPFYRYTNFYGNPGNSNVWISGLITAGGNDENCAASFNSKVIVTRYGRIVNYGPNFTLQLSPD